MTFHHGTGDHRECIMSTLREPQNLMRQRPELSGLRWPCFKQKAGLDDCVPLPNINYFGIHWRISEAVIFYEIENQQLA